MNDKFTLILITILILLALLFGWTSMKQTPGDSLVVRTLKAQGLEDIATGPALLGYCDKGQLPTGFTATKGGASVSGVVCVDNILQTAYIKYK